MINFSNKYVIIAFFKIPIENNKEIVVNKHVNDKDVKIKECMNGKKFIKENPGFRNGFTKNCFYNIHNKNYIENFLTKNTLKFEWMKYEKGMHQQPLFSKYKNKDLPICDKITKNIFSIPCYDTMDNDEIELIIRIINSF